MFGTKSAAGTFGSDLGVLAVRAPVQKIVLASQAPVHKTILAVQAPVQTTVLAVQAAVQKTILAVQAPVHKISPCSTGQPKNKRSNLLSRPVGCLGLAWPGILRVVFESEG